MYELVSLELRRLNKRFAALRAHVHPGPVRVQVFAHGTVVPEHFVATLKTQTILVNKIISYINLFFFIVGNYHRRGEMGKFRHKQI